jgi:hypothetical protein
MALRDEHENVSDSTRVNRESGSNENDETGSQSEKHEYLSNSIFRGISIE